MSKLRRMYRVSMCCKGGWSVAQFPTTVRQKEHIPQCRHARPLASTLTTLHILHQPWHKLVAKHQSGLRVESMSSTERKRLLRETCRPCTSSLVHYPVDAYRLHALEIINGSSPLPAPLGFHPSFFRFCLSRGGNSPSQGSKMSRNASNQNLRQDKRISVLLVSPVVKDDLPYQSSTRVLDIVERHL